MRQEHLKRGDYIPQQKHSFCVTFTSPQHLARSELQAEGVGLLQVPDNGPPWACPWKRQVCGKGATMRQESTVWRLGLTPSGPRDAQEVL